MDFTQELAEDLCSISYAQLPAATVETTEMAIASSIAAAATAQRQRSVTVVRDLIMRRKSVPDSQVWFTGGERTSIADAARLNHMAADESMADDSALLNGSHLGSAVTAAALAVGETTCATGPAVIAAVVAGYEAAIRIGRAEAQLRTQRNTHVSGLNAFGCAVATAKLLGSGTEAMAHTIVLAATGTSGVDRVSTNDARAYQAGFSAAVGVEAALAAHYGYRAATSVMDRYLDLIEFNGLPTGKSASPGGAYNGRLAIDTELIIKLRPGAFLFGSAVEAALRVITGNGLAVDAIGTVTIRGHRFFVETDANRPLPNGSLTWYIASTMVRRSFNWSHFADDHHDDAAIAHLRDRIRIEPTSAEDAPGTWGWAAEVIVETRDGSIYRSTVDLPPGAVIAGVSWGQIDAKAHELMAGVNVASDRIERILTAVKRLHESPKTETLTGLLD